MQYETINKRIKSLRTFDDVVKRIDTLNDLILEALAERSQYPICADIFGKHKIPVEKNENPQYKLEQLGLDTVGWNGYYHPIVKQICEKGDHKEGVIEAEAKLEQLVYERIQIGEKVAKYKKRAEEITRPEREEKIIANMREKSKKYSLNPDNVEWIFRFLIEQNKAVQEVYMRMEGKIRSKELSSQSGWTG